MGQKEEVEYNNSYSYEQLPNALKSQFWAHINGIMEREGELTGGKLDSNSSSAIKIK
jgi:hypothetical protein